MPSDDLNNPITNYLDTEQASKLTPAAKKLTKQGMLSALNSYANGGTLTAGLQKADIMSVRDAFSDRISAVGVSLGGSCCCCCTAVATTTTVGPLRFSSIATLPGTWSAAADDNPPGHADPPACCCCCI
jgi:hypothetical protein